MASVKEAAKSLLEQASLVSGIKVGGELKFRTLRSGEVPFGSSCVQLAASVTAPLHLQPSKIGTRQMQYFCDPEKHAQPEEDIGFGDSNPGVISDDEISQASDAEDEEEIVQQHYRMRFVAQQSPPADLCTMGAFLTSPRTLVSLFASHARRHSDVNDKTAPRVNSCREDAKTSSPFR